MSVVVHFGCAERDMSGVIFLGKLSDDQEPHKTVIAM
jgi:hypothetical protein